MPISQYPTATVVATIATCVFVALAATSFVTAVHVTTHRPSRRRNSMAAMCLFSAGVWLLCAAVELLPGNLVIAVFLMAVSLFPIGYAIHVGRPPRRQGADLTYLAHLDRNYGWAGQPASRPHLDLRRPADFDQREHSGPQPGFTPADPAVCTSATDWKRHRAGQMRIAGSNAFLGLNAYTGTTGCGLDDAMDQAEYNLRCAEWGIPPRERTPVDRMPTCPACFPPET